MSKLNKENLIELGTCNKPFGIKGGFFFKLYSGQDSILSNKDKVTLIPKSGSSSIAEEGEEYIIKTISFGNKTTCYLEGIDDRNVVEAMIPFSILFPLDQFPATTEGEVYIRDLIGLTVIDSEGAELGEVTGSYDNTAQTVLELTLKSGKIELPFVESFFPEVDIKNNKITLINPEIIE